MKGHKKKIRDNRYLNWLLILSNWLIQGILHADKTEKVYKIISTIVYGITISAILIYYSKLPLIWSLFLGLVIGHSINWILNSNFCSLIVHRLLASKTSKRNIFNYLTSLQNRINSKSWVLYSAAFGSICRGMLTDSSDLDISIVRNPGLNNAIKALCFVFIEKKRADFMCIPLELWLSDSPEDSKNRFKVENNPVVISDKIDSLDKYYEDKLSIHEAKLLNRVS